MIAEVLDPLLNTKDTDVKMDVILLQHYSNDQLEPLNL
jgi:hypothetical protein